METVDADFAIELLFGEELFNEKPSG